MYVGHNVVRVDSLENLVVMLNKPEEKTPPFIYVTVWPKPEGLKMETYVRIELLPDDLQAQIREKVRGVKISESAETGVPK